MEKLKVCYCGSIVGYLAKFNNKYAFEYDEDWIQNGFSISPFSLPLKKGVFVPNDNTFNGFFGVFAKCKNDINTIERRIGNAYGSYSNA